MTWKDRLKRVRGSAWRLARPIDPTGLRRAEPVSRRFGLERGTPVDRRYIEAFLDRHRAAIRGRTLEIGDDTYTRRFGDGRVTASEVLHAAPGNPRATLVADLTDPAALPADWVDCFVCTQTLNFVYDVRAAVASIHRLLAPGGVALVTLAGLSQVSRFDMDRWGDYWRFSPLAARRAFEEAFGAGVEVDACGNVLAATALLHGLAVEDLPEAALLDRPDPDYPVVVTVRATKGAAEKSVRPEAAP